MIILPVSGIDSEMHTKDYMGTEQGTSRRYVERWHAEEMMLCYTDCACLDIDIVVDYKGNLAMKIMAL